MGIIGVGRRGLELARVLVRHGEEAGLRLVALQNRTRAKAEEAVAELDLLDAEVLSRAESRRSAAEAPSQSRPHYIRVYDSAADLIDDPAVGLVMVCTPQYAHREPAIGTLDAGKLLSLDKPIAHTIEDAAAIAQAENRSSCAHGAAARPFIMSFTRRFEAPWTRAWDLIHKDRVIGPVRMILARNVIPYHIYFHTWHRRIEWSGGALADKMSHMFDVFSWFANDEPIRVSAVGGQAVFRPAPDFPERCSVCDRDCPYRAADGPGASAGDNPLRRADTCVWRPGADINDHGVVTVEMKRGAKTTLFWSLFGPDADDQETVEVVGDRGRLILTRQTGMIDLVTDYGARHEILDARGADADTSHFGADIEYIRALGRYARGEKPVVSGTDGLRAARVVDAAHRSIEGHGRPIELEDSKQ